MAEFDSKGRQIPDPRPVEVPADFRRPLSLQDEIRRFVRSELSKAAHSQALETFEEADDFEIEDDDTDLDFDGSKYQVVEMVPAMEAPDADPPKDRAPARSAVDSGTIAPSAGAEETASTA